MMLVMEPMTFDLSYWANRFDTLSASGFVSILVLLFLWIVLMIFEFIYRKKEKSRGIRILTLSLAGAVVLATVTSLTFSILMFQSRNDAVDEMSAAFGVSGLDGAHRIVFVDGERVLVSPTPRDGTPLGYDAAWLSYDDGIATLIPLAPASS